MTPLHWPDDFDPGRDVGPCGGPPSSIEAAISNQLSMRSEPSADRWGSDPARASIGRALCAAIQHEYRWPNARFIPADPVDVALLMPWDDLNIVEIVMDLEERLHFEIHDSIPEGWPGRCLRNVVESLVHLARNEGRSN